MTSVQAVRRTPTTSTAFRSDHHPSAKELVRVSQRSIHTYRGTMKLHRPLLILVAVEAALIGVTSVHAGPRRLSGCLSAATSQNTVSSFTDVVVD